MSLFGGMAELGELIVRLVKLLWDLLLWFLKEKP